MSRRPFTFTADRDGLHLEARDNYENLKTGSVWVGYNFGGGEKLARELTPMFGAVSGETNGVALGYRGPLSWHRGRRPRPRRASSSLYSEGEERSEKWR